MLTLQSFARRYAFPHWVWYAAGLLFLAATNLITLEIPQLAKAIVNGLQVDDSTSDMRKIAWLIVGLGLLQILVRSLSRILIFWPGRKLEVSSKTDFFSKTMTLPQAFFVRFGMGDLVSRLSNDMSQLRVFFAFAVLQLFNMLFLLVFTITKMFTAHEALTLACLAPITLMLVIMRFIMPRLHKYSRLNQDALGRLTGKVTEAFANVHVIQANAAQATFLTRAEVENEEVFTTNMKVVGVRTFFFPLLTSLTNISQLLVLFYGGYAVMHNEISIGDILAFNIYLGYLAFPLASIGIIMSIYKRAKTALERIEIFDEETPQTAVAGPAEQRVGADLLTIRQLDFSFQQAGIVDQTKSERFSLAGINFTVKKGEKLGIFGPVGSGKSTLFNLITRIFEPPEGMIFWQGRDIVTLSPQDLRTAIGYALQSVHLFSDSIAENLKFGLGFVPTQAQLEEAARAAQIYDEIMQFEDKWDTKIGERGIRLSGGQKQRLALARLFLRRPQLFLLDDVLSAVDNQTEARLIQHIFYKNPDSTVLLASHRVSALRHCNRIVVMSEGRIADVGTFEALLSRHPELREEEHEKHSHDHI